ncbi:MAG: hypothetical protein ACTSYI_01825 [Promethearchaeota archaeon]
MGLTIPSGQNYVRNIEFSYYFGMHGFSIENDDSFEENDHQKNATWLDAPGLWGNLYQFDDDYYYFLAPASSHIEIIIECYIGSIWIEERDYTNFSLIQKDMSTDEGKLNIRRHVDEEEYILFGIFGPNTGEMYDIEIIISNPSDTNAGDTSDDNPFATLDFSSIPGYSTYLFLITGLTTIMIAGFVGYSILKKND